MPVPQRFDSTGRMRPLSPARKRRAEGTRWTDAGDSQQSGYTSSFLAGFPKTLAPALTFLMTTLPAPT